jgi:hypothetical protein
MTDHGSSPDIVEALRGLADTLMNGSGKTVEISYADIRHAADEIERLRASLQPATPTATGARFNAPGCCMGLAPEDQCECAELEKAKATASDAVAGEALVNDIATRSPGVSKQVIRRLLAAQDAQQQEAITDAAATATVPKGWKLVPERPTQRQMDAGLYQSSADSEWDDVYSIYADMIDVAPSVDERNEPVADPRPVAQGSGYPAEEYAKVALGNAVEVGRLEILVARMERAVKAASVYYGCYVQDEAEEVECCISSEHHEAAKELRDALREATLAMTSTEGK